MIRRKWVIYDRKSRQIISVLYSFRRDALYDLKRLNDYYGKKKYAMQLRKFDTERKHIVLRHPDIELKELPGREGIKDG
jgi:hypothetical protein